MRPTTIVISSGDLRVLSPGGRVLAKRALTQLVRRPAFKWAGGKQWLAAAASTLAPMNWKGIYFEPFLGGAAFFFGLEPRKAVLSDRNSELIETYRALQLDPDRVIDTLDSFPNDPDFYYYLRNARPRSQHTVAARLLYLVQTCWNGLYRVNKNGKFNTPFGHYANPSICDAIRIDEAAEALARAVLKVGDFEAILNGARQGDFAYCDPPYITGHKDNGFLKYNATLFAWSDQRRLAKVAAQLKDRGAHLLISNANHESVLELYSGFRHYRLTRRSLIAADSKNRRMISEALLSSYPILGCESEIIR